MSNEPEQLTLPLDNLSRQRESAPKREESRQAHMNRGACPHDYGPVETKRTENPRLGTWTEDSMRTCKNCGATLNMGRQFNNWSGD